MSKPRYIVSGETFNELVKKGIIESHYLINVPVKEEELPPIPDKEEWVQLELFPKFGSNEYKLKEMRKLAKAMLDV